jgi:predicted dehydrogenase
MGGPTHLPAVASHDACTVVAICGRDRERAELLAEKYGVPSVDTDYQPTFDQAPPAGQNPPLGTTGNALVSA